MVDVRLIVDPPLPGAWNMGIDEALLLDSVENGTATLRFYQWGEPTLSLGYFQSYADREQHPASRNCAVVRRQTGGGAILHDRELTYSLTLPPGNPLSRNSADLYSTVHREFIAALSSGSPMDTGSTALRIRGDEAPPETPGEPFLCFQRQAAGDVVLGRQPDKLSTGGDASPDRALPWKVLGSAQRRHRGAILQHGSLLVETSPAAPELPGLRDLTGPLLPTEKLIEAVCDRLTRALNLVLIPRELPAELQSKAAELTNNKYGSDGWTKRR